MSKGGVFLDLDRVIVLFGLFANLPQSDLPTWTGLCSNAVSFLEGKLPASVVVSEHKERLCTTAAAFAYADYLMVSGGGSSSGEQIKVGDITLGSSQNSDVRRDSRSIREYFMGQISDLIGPSGFVFAAVGGKTDET